MSEFGPRLAEKKWVIALAVIVFLLTTGLILLIIFYGAAAGDPRGEHLGPGP